MYHVIGLDLGTQHEADYVIRHVPDSKCNLWIILCFQTDCMIETADGLVCARPGDCFIKSPKFIEYHYTPKGATKGFVNDWMHLTSDCIERDMEELSLPVNTLIHTGHPLFMRSNMQKIFEERIALHPFWERKVSNLAEAIFINLAKVHQNEQNADSMVYEEPLLRLRECMQENIDRQWSVEEMAYQVQLSASRFSVLYKRRFGYSPNEDLIGMRLEKAKLLLLSSSKGLREIAQLCGFQNEYYFSRVFKLREKISPGVFRHQL